MSKESRTAEQKTNNKNLLKALVPVIVGVLVSVTLVLLIQKNNLFSSDKASSDSSVELSKNTPLQNLHADSNPKIEIITDIGPILIELYPEYATDIVNELVELSQSGYYNDSTVMESIPPFGFVIAKIGPTAKTFSFKSTNNNLTSVRGSVAISKLAAPKAYLNNLFFGFQPHEKIQEQYISLSTYTIPVFAAVTFSGEEAIKAELTDMDMQLLIGAGNVDATMPEYVKFDPNVAPIAEAVISNRSIISVPYVLEVMDINGVTLEELASGTLVSGETKVISGSATVVNKSSVRVRVGGPFGLEAIDTAWLITRQQ